MRERIGKLEEGVSRESRTKSLVYKDRRKWFVTASSKDVENMLKPHVFLAQRSLSHRSERGVQSEQEVRSGEALVRKIKDMENEDMCAKHSRL